MLKILMCIASVYILSTSAQTWLRAGSGSDAVTVINKVFGGDAVETSECSHKVKHITMTSDGKLNRRVFQFHIHVDEDNDNCSKFDRQRTEIKISNASPDVLKGFQQETVYLSWNFKLDAAFQPSQSFTHIHQLKDVGGKSGTPIITISPRKGKAGKADDLQIIHVNSNGEKTIIGDTPLAALKGNWIHVEEKIKYGRKGSYFINITKVSDGSDLLTINKNNLELWRDGAEYVRPKWGIYRSLDRKSELRDEIVGFDSFCLDKGKNRCS